MAIALFAIGIRSYVRARSVPSWRQLGLAAEHDISDGGLQGLWRARISAVSVTAVLTKDSDAAATVALANAMLQSEYGLDASAAALTAADEVTRSQWATARAKSLELTSRALLHMARGDLAKAESQALMAVAQDQEQPASVFALGRVRYRRGDLDGAARALQAALLRDPDFTEARVAIAEVLLDQGEHRMAKEALLSSLQKNHHHTRAQLLLLEATAATAEKPLHDWHKSCERDGKNSPFLAGFCDLARAEQAWQSHNLLVVTEYAEAVGNRRPSDPRVLGRAAQLLASLGRVDRASNLADEATRFASVQFPATQWARTSIDLGRGRLTEMPANLPMVSSLIGPSLMARITLASAGIKALSEAVQALQKEPLHQGPVMHSFLSFLNYSQGNANAEAAYANDPVLAYVMGLQARLLDDIPASTRLLARGLHSHGDACRAAGEYLAACRVLGLRPAPDAFDFLKTRNRGCVHLPAAMAAFQEHPAKSRRVAPRGNLEIR